MHRVFISYRRSDTAREAHGLKTILEGFLSDVAVFVDTDDIPGGAAWPDRLRDELARSVAVLALIGPDWRGGDGEDRILDEGDWVRRELEVALETAEGRLLPVVVEDAHSVLDHLPPSLTALATLQHEPLTVDHWLDDVHAIAAWVARAVGADSRPLGPAFPQPDALKKLFPALTADEIDRLLSSGGVSGWSTAPIVLPDAAPGTIELHKVFEFDDFSQAFAFMSRVAAKAEDLNHHPDWRNVWNRVHVSQRTWDAGHIITVFDFEMAAFMNKVAAEVRNPAV